VTVSCRFFTSLRKGDSHLKHNTFICTPHGTHSSPHNRALLPHTLTRRLYVDHCLHNVFPVPAPTPTTSTRGAQAIFRAKPVHVLYPTFSTAVTLHTCPPMNMEQTECSETLAFKLLKTERTLLYIRKQPVPRCKHFPPRL
jgi:hypothetical protein